MSDMTGRWPYVLVHVTLASIAGFVAGTHGPLTFLFFALGYLSGSFVLDALWRTKGER